MNKDIKVTIPMYSVTAFLIAHTDMNVKEKITETFAAFAKGDLTFKGVDLSFNFINDDEHETKEISFIKPSLDLSDIAVVTCLAGYKKYKVSSVLRGIFETAVIIKNHKKLLENGCFGAAPKQIASDPTFDEIIKLVKKEPYKITLAELVSSQKTKKRTDAFIDRLYRRLDEESIVMTFVNGDEISPEKFKEIYDFDTKIILKCTKTQEESNGESDDKAQETAKAETDAKARESAETTTDEENTETADAAEAEDGAEDQTTENPETSEPEADKKEYEVEERGDPMEDSSSMRFIS